MLGMDGVFKSQQQVGIGIVQDVGGRLTNYYTIDTAVGATQRPFLIGARSFGMGTVTAGTISAKAWVA